MEVFVDLKAVFDMVNRETVKAMTRVVGEGLLQRIRVVEGDKV